LGVSGSTVLTVSAAVLQSITVSSVNSSIAKGTTEQFTATGIYSDLTTVDLTTSGSLTWSSSAPGVATVSNAGGSRGLATGVGVGNASITAQSGGIVGGAGLAVTAATLSTIAVTPTTQTIAKGTKKQYTAVGTYSDSSTQDL